MNFDWRGKVILMKLAEGCTIREAANIAEETIAQWDAAGLTLPAPLSPTPMEVDPVGIRNAMSVS